MNLREKDQLQNLLTEFICKKPSGKLGHIDFVKHNNIDTRYENSIKKPSRRSPKQKEIVDTNH